MKIRIFYVGITIFSVAGSILIILVTYAAFSKHYWGSVVVGLAFAAGSIWISQKLIRAAVEILRGYQVDDYEIRCERPKIRIALSAIEGFTEDAEAGYLVLQDAGGADLHRIPIDHPANDKIKTKISAAHPMLRVDKPSEENRIEAVGIDRDLSQLKWPYAMVALLVGTLVPIAACYLSIVAFLYPTHWLLAYFDSTIFAGFYFTALIVCMSFVVFKSIKYMNVFFFLILVVSKDEKLSNYRIGIHDFDYPGHWLKEPRKTSEN